MLVEFFRKNSYSGSEEEIITYSRITSGKKLAYTKFYPAIKIKYDRNIVAL